jgi:mono/diheme cytochrome c family protein
MGREYVRNFRRFSVRIAVLLMLAGACVCAQAQTDTGKSAGASSAKVDSGKSAFSSAGCAACHGVRGQGTALAPQIAPPPVELPALISYVRQPSGTMPAVSAATASDQQLSDIYAFLKSEVPASQAGEAATGNAANGKKLFLAYGCYQCHGYEGQGASTGPRIGPPPLTLAFLISYVRHPTGQMPPYTDKVVPDQDLTDIFAYLKTKPQPARASSIPLLNQ